MGLVTTGSRKAGGRRNPGRGRGRTAEGAAAPAGVARETAPLFGPRRSSSARRAGGEWFPGSDFDSRGGQCGAWAMPSRLTAPSARRSVRPAVSARPGETPPRPSGVLAAPLPESGPGGPPARPEAAPPAPRAGHWTRDEQIGSLIRVADRQPDVGFMVRLLVSALHAAPAAPPRARAPSAEGSALRMAMAGSPARARALTIVRAMRGAWSSSLHRPDGEEQQRRTGVGERHGRGRVRQRRRALLSVTQPHTQVLLRFREPECPVSRPRPAAVARQSSPLSPSARRRAYELARSETVCGREREPCP